MLLVAVLQENQAIRADLRKSVREAVKLREELKQHSAAATRG